MDPDFPGDGRTDGFGSLSFRHVIAAPDHGFTHTGNDEPVCQLLKYHGKGRPGVGGDGIVRQNFRQDGVWYILFHNSFSFFQMGIQMPEPFSGMMQAAFHCTFRDGKQGCDFRYRPLVKVVQQKNLPVGRGKRRKGFPDQYGSCVPYAGILSVPQLHQSRFFCPGCPVIVTDPVPGNLTDPWTERRRIPQTVPVPECCQTDFLQYIFRIRRGKPIPCQPPQHGQMCLQQCLEVVQSCIPPFRCSV